MLLSTGLRTLGIGAGLTTSATAGYFPSGTTSSVMASFDPWWESYPDPLDLSYWAASSDQVTANELRIYTPDQYQADYVDFSFPACSKAGPTYLAIQPIRAGVGIPDHPSLAGS